MKREKRIMKLRICDCISGTSFLLHPIKVHQCRLGNLVICLYSLYEQYSESFRFLFRQILQSFICVVSIFLIQQPTFEHVLSFLYVYKQAFRPIKNACISNPGHILICEGEYIRKWFSNLHQRAFEVKSIIIENNNEKSASCFLVSTTK